MWVYSKMARYEKDLIGGKSVGYWGLGMKIYEIL